MRIVAIAAVADNGVIGSGEDMLWHIPADFRRFKAVTTGNTIIFGRRTHEQIGLLPNRRTIVVTRQPDWSAEGVEVAHSIEEAIRLAHTTPGKTCFIGGGGEIYAAAWPSPMSIRNRRGPPPSRSSLPTNGPRSAVRSTRAMTSCSTGQPRRPNEPAGSCRGRSLT